MTQDFAQRIAVIVALVHRVSGRRLGRTAIMKLMYFLSVLRGVPLGYRFTLYSYGPFDSTVLDDLNSGQQLGILKMRIVGYPSGYGYEIEAGPNVTAPLEFASRFVKKHKEDIDWVVAKFGRSPAAELELAGTIVYVDRESPACRNPFKNLPNSWVTSSRIFHLPTFKRKPMP